MASEYIVNVGNIGNIRCESMAEAEKTYAEYLEQSKSGHGRAGGEYVGLMVDGEPVKEHFGVDRDEMSKGGKTDKDKGKYMATWGDWEPGQLGYPAGYEKVDIGFFNEDKGYEKTDIDAIKKLERGQKWTSEHGNHDVLRLEDGGYMAFGGRSKSAIAKDRKYSSSQKHELGYERKGETLHYHTKNNPMGMEKGGEVILYTKDRKYSQEEIADILYKAILNRVKVDASMLIGRKIVLKNKKNNLSAEIYFDTATTSGIYSTIRIKIINSATQTQENIATIRIDDVKYGNPPIKAKLPNSGHYWEYDKSFYGYVPDFNLILNDIAEYLNLMSIPKGSKYDGGSMAVGGKVDKEEIKKRLEELRKELRAEQISWGELHELQSLAEYIEPGDVELLEAAGVPEFPEEDSMASGGRSKAAIAKDRKYTSSEPHELAYDRKGKTIHYKKHEDGGSMATGGDLKSIEREIGDVEEEIENTTDEERLTELHIQLDELEAKHRKASGVKADGGSMSSGGIIELLNTKIKLW